MLVCDILCDGVWLDCSDLFCVFVFVCVCVCSCLYVWVLLLVSCVMLYDIVFFLCLWVLAWVSVVVSGLCVFLLRCMCDVVWCAFCVFVGECALFECVWVFRV